MMEPHDLYGLPLDDFTERRNALAKQLRGQGRRDEAAAVLKLRKPSVAAWAVNQLVRTQPRDLDRLLKAGDVLARAQANLLAKRGDPSALREAAEAERAAVEQLVGKARGLLDSDGHELTPPRLEQVTETLHAAALDEDARASVRDGCLVRELRRVGLGPLATVDSSGPKRRPAGRPRQAKQREAPQAQAGRRELAAKQRAAREAEAAARRRLETATRREATAERRRERALTELKDAENTLAAAQDATAKAEREHQQAKRLLDEL